MKTAVGWVVRNGYHQPRDVLTAAGAVEVTAPRVNDKRIDPDTRLAAAVLLGDPAGRRRTRAKRLGGEFGRHRAS